MKRKFTLFASLLLSASFSFAEGVINDDAFWVIKDGKIASGIEEVPYSDLGTKIPNVLKDTVVNGEDVVVYKQLSEDFLDVRLAFENTVDLSKNYTLLLEYQIPSSHHDTLLYDEEKWRHKPLFILGLAQTIDNLEAKNAPHSDAIVFVDGKWGPTEQWVTTQKYIYSLPTITELNGMIVSYAREYNKGDLTEFPYIKNLAFITSDTHKPFYAENFGGYGLGEFYQEKNNLKKTTDANFCGGIKPVFTAADQENFEDEGRPVLLAFRDFIPDHMGGSDGSGYLDCEILHGLQVDTHRDSIVIPGIQIPEGCTKIFSKMLIKKHKNEKKTWVDADYSEVANLDMPIKAKFSTGEIVDLANDTIKLIWTKFEGALDVPNGATTLDLIFPAMPVGYLVNEIMLSAAYFTDVNDFIAENNAFEVEAYVNADGSISVANGELQAIYNLSGQIASESDKMVVILVKNAEGKVSSKVLVRK